MEVGSHEGTVSFKQKITKTSKEPVDIVGSVDYMTCDDGKCIFPPAVDFELKLTAGDGSYVAVSESDETETIGEEKSEDEDDRSYWGIFFISFFSGFAALLTPCVFPMIPMTVSFFTKQSKTKAAGIKNAILYGVSIIVYLCLAGRSCYGCIWCIRFSQSWLQIPGLIWHSLFYS